MKREGRGRREKGNVKEKEKKGEKLKFKEEMGRARRWREDGFGSGLHGDPLHSTNTPQACFLSPAHSLPL